MSYTTKTVSRQPDKIKRTETYRTEKAIVTLCYPDITPEENKRRKELIKKAAVELLKEKIRFERERERKERENEKTKQQ